MPNVSVIIPVYNTEKYLRKCLDSICNQTLSDIEIICINDCSPDNSLEILKEYATKDDRVKIIDFKENKGAAVARNSAIDEAIGEYIGFVDSDDFVDLDFYEKLYNKAIETGADVAKGNIYTYNPSTQKVELTDFYNMNDKIQENKYYFYYGFTSAIYKLSLIKENDICFPENIKYFEDPYFSIKVCINCKNLKIVSNVKYYYTNNITGSSQTNNSNIIEYDFTNVFDYIVDIINDYDLEKNNYLILYDFLYNFLLQKIGDKNLSNNTYSLLITQLLKLILKCKVENTYYQDALQRVSKNGMLKLMKGMIKINVK